MRFGLSFLAAVTLLAACSSSPSVSIDTSPADAIAEDLAADTDVHFATDSGAVDSLAHETFELSSPDVPDVPLLQCEPGEGCFMDGCGDNADCQSGWCVEHLGEKICTQSCQEECPAGWSCQQVAGTEPDLVFVCVSDYPNLCRPCTEADDCQGATGTEDACVAYGDQGAFCGGTCGNEGACPWGFACQTTTTVDGIELEQCVAETGECPCTESAVELGLFTACQVTNDFGTCAGKRVCTADGLTDCSAPEPAAETCNGLDDDCDGDVDEPDLVDGDYINLCHDDNECTDDKCTGEEGCLNELLDSGPCEDGDPCTVADHCVEGQCVGEAVECDDDNACTDDSCTETGGCEHEPNQLPCDDDDPCTVADHCGDGECGGTPVSCECQTDADCGALEDGNLCNGTLICDTAIFPYQCVVDPSTEVDCPPAETYCQQAVCDPLSGECGTAAANEGKLCEDGDACTYNAVCSEGTCAGGTPLNCNDGNPCTDDSCDPQTGCTHANNDAPCEDGNHCTLQDKCGDGWCQGGEPPVCNDGKQCTADSCDPTTGCVSEPLSDVPCDDENACTLNDTCQSGACFGGESPDCADDNPCTDDLCLPGEGCVTVLNEDLCDDGDVCSLGDRCELGVCTPVATMPCDDGNSCTDDACDPDFGCQFTPNQSGCDDGNACTVADLCLGGWCVSGAALDCDDGNVCTNDSCEPALGCVTTVVDDGTSCGETPNFQCVQGQCACLPDCQGWECGGDGCGGLCGTCGEETFCALGKCLAPMALADSGMTTCFNTVGPIECPAPGAAFYGQDGSYQTTPMSFTDNGDHTVTDEVTGLVWGNCNAGRTGTDCAGEDVVLGYQKAIAYCEGNEDGLPGDGWRLPNLDELTSIVDYEAAAYKVSPPFGGVNGTALWSTPVGLADETHCFVSFGTGQTACGFLDPEVGRRFRCVRGAERATGNFVDNGNGTVTDEATGLIWLRESLDTETWQNAMAACEELDFAGQDDWRLPNVREIATLRDHRLPDKGLHEAVFLGGDKDVWSGTTFQSSQYNSSAYALSVNGTVGYFSDSKYGGKAVRCVRQVCTPDCAGRSCGDDGCGGQCGKCDAGFACNSGSCKSTGAVWFKNNYVQVADPGIEGARSYSFWLYLYDVQATQTLLIKKDTPGDPVPARPVNLGVKEGQLRARMMWLNGGGSQELFAVPIDPYQWYHVVWQASPEQAQLFLNGALVGEQELPGESIDNDYDYTVGGAPVISNFGNFVTGYIYNLRIVEGFVHDVEFTPCWSDVLDDDSHLVDGTGPMACNCQPSCGGKNCGPDGCGGQCGTCGAGSACQFGVCLAAGPGCLSARYSLAGDAQDDSGNGHHCEVLSPEPAADRFEAPSEALDFDGTNDYVNCGDSDVLESTGQFTISLWVNLASLTANPLVNKWYSSDTSNRNSYALHIRPDYLSLSVSNGTLKYDQHSFPYQWQLGHWYHIVVTYQAGTVEAFIDGQSQGAQPGTITAIGNVNDPLKFGDWYHQYNPGHPGTSYYPLDGLLDDVRMYSCKLANSDVLSLYNGGQ